MRFHRPAKLKLERWQVKDSAEARRVPTVGARVFLIDVQNK